MNPQLETTFNKFLMKNSNFRETLHTYEMRARDSGLN